MTADADRYRYRAGPRGDRLSPGLTHPSRCVLIELRDRIREIIDSGLVSRSARILDYGCGEMPYRPLLEPLVREYVGADFPGNPDAQIIISPSGRIEAPDESFDCVLSTQVLEHVEEPRLYLREAHRVLKPAGILVLSTHGFWPYHPDPCDYWRWTLDGLQLEVARSGLTVVSVRSVLGKASSAIQLWQSATAAHLPRILQPLYFLSLQSLIGIIERARPTSLSLDASVYVVAAGKMEAPGPAQRVQRPSAVPGSPRDA